VPGKVIDHLQIRTSDRAASEAFYDTVLGTLGVHKRAGEHFAIWGDFLVSQASDEHPVTRGLHIAWFAPTTEEVDAFYAAGIDAGYRSDGEPGPRPIYGDDYYGGFLLDPDGNSVEAVNVDDERVRGQVDHLWIRVADLAAARAFYELVPGISVEHAHPDRVQFAHPSGTLSLVHDERPPTEYLHLAFPAAENATVDAWHAAALAAGFRDNGGPGERPAYHPGYYAAFAFDPDGNNIEMVNHNRS
jgi:catechol 2,3-dioxygenase-like lactoylglutathione lyase family enzyme